MQGIESNNIMVWKPNSIIQEECKHGLCFSRHIQTTQVKLGVTSKMIHHVEIIVSE
jgi:hypothetical protein